MESLAQGPLGETFRAKVYGVAGLEKQYALKQIDAALRVDPDVRARLLDAARWYARLEHERIARLTEIHDEGESLYLVVELSRGIDLLRLSAHLRTRGESLPVDQAILIALDVTEALEAAHGANVLHAGLVPAVVSVLGEGEVRVSDFAISSVLGRPGWAEDDALVSLSAYSAPERLQGEAPNSFSDIWSVGALLYELASGQPLFSGTTAAALRAARAQPIGWDRVPIRPGLRELLQKVLADDPLLRPHTATELKDALSGLLNLDLPRARAGLQGLAKRALGRAMTRTGSFAAVAIPSASFPALTQEPPPTVPQANAGARTLVGLSTSTPSAPQAALVPPTPPSKGRAWAPPRATGTIPTVGDSGPITLRGLGDAKAEVPGEPPQMELAVLPPQEPPLQPSTATGEHTAPVPFEDQLTSPHDRMTLTETTLTDEPVLVLEANPSDSVAHRIADAEAVENSDLIVVDEGPTNQVVRVSPPPPPERVGPPSLEPVPPPPILRSAPPSNASAALPALTPTDEPPLPPTVPVPPDTLRDAQPPAQVIAPAPAKSGGSGAGVAIVFVGLLLIGGAGGFVWWRRHHAPVSATPQVGVTASTAIPVPAHDPGRAVAAVDLAAAIATPDLSSSGAESKPVEKAEPPKPVVEKVEPPKPVVEKVDPPKPVVEKVDPPTPSAVPAGSVAVQTTPSTAEVWLDGERRGVTPLQVPLAAGAHKLVLVLPGHKVVHKTINVASDGTRVEQALEIAKLPESVAGNGGLKVRCKTSGELRILVDGNDTGTTCPNPERIPVQPGTHTIGLFSPRTGETKTVEGEVDDDPDRSTRIYTKY